jgi:hypothetical protein
VVLLADASLPFRRDLAEVGSIGHPRRLGE